MQSKKIGGMCMTIQEIHFQYIFEPPHCTLYSVAFFRCQSGMDLIFTVQNTLLVAILNEFESFFLETIFFFRTSPIYYRKSYLVSINFKLLTIMIVSAILNTNIQFGYFAQKQIFFNPLSCCSTI